ncbi:MAG: response regulator [Gemmatimonadetes bacterium]|nr:response regulator [Gemmatimonadota bacterium]
MTSAPAKPRLLIVDDSADDVELVRRALTRGGVSASITRVDDAVSFRRALAEQSWDLVIADYSQPSFGALAVLEQLRQAQRDLPCLVMSGVAGEDRAVQTMRAGAKDFVSKDRLQRLAPAVQRELAEAALRRDRARREAEESLREERLRGAGVHVLEVLRSDAFTNGRAVEVYRDLTALVAHALDVDRVSIWLFNETRSGFHCVELFDRRSAIHSDGLAYAIEEHPAYFEALERSRFVEAHDAASEHRGAGEDTATISAQLDAAIRVHGAMVGALCLDHVGGRRRWRGDEQMFVGSIADLVALVMETQERRRAELALRESEVRYRDLWQNALDGMLTLDPAGRITSINAAGCSLVGATPSEILGRDFTEFLVPRDADLARGIFTNLVTTGEGVPGPVAVSVQRASGRAVQAEASAQRIERDGDLVEVLAIVRDVSQRRQLEAQLQQSQKMEAIGRLAGGVAHDFNNLLTAIIGYSQIAAIRPGVPAPALLDLKEITSAAHRAAALTRQLLAFSRRQVLEPRVLNLNAVVTGIEVLLRRLIGEDITFTIDLATNVAAVLADPSQLEQVVLNLAVNARDAMPDGGSLVVRTRMADAPDKPLSTPGSDAGPFVVLEVADTGTGMDEETRLHVFEPFYTTKELGTGLGLSTVYGIVQQSGGSIAVESEPGRGTTFSVYLPVASGDVAAHDLPSVPSGPGGTETILVVEDDDRVRALASRVLTLGGYTVLEASDPEAALALSVEQREIHLLLADLVMPVMRGSELFQRLRQRRGQLRVLYISGYRSSADRPDVEDAAFLPKPFTPDMLAAAVRAVLDAPSTRSVDVVPARR